MVDSKRTGSQSRYVSRQANVLRFTLDAFLFAEADSEVSLSTSYNITESVINLVKVFLFKKTLFNFIKCYRN